MNGNETFIPRMRFRGALVALALVLVLAGTLLPEKRVQADSGNIGGGANVLSVNLLNAAIQANYGSLNLGPSGTQVGGSLAAIGVNAQNVGISGVATISLPLTSATASRTCQGSPGPQGTVTAHCISLVEGLNLALAANLLGSQALNVPFITADVIRAEARTTGSGGTVSSTANGSTIVGLRVNGNPVANVSPGTVIPVNLTIDIGNSNATGASVQSILNTLSTQTGSASATTLLNTVNALLFGQQDGLLSSVTNSLGVNASLGVTGSIAVNQRTPGGNGSTSSSMDVVMLDVNLAVTLQLDLALTSNLTVASCSSYFSPLEALVNCTVGALLGSLNTVLTGLVGQNSLLGGTLQSVLSTLGLSWGQSGVFNGGSAIGVNLGVIDLTVVEANSAVAGYTMSIETPTPTLPPASTPTATNTPGPGTPTATSTPTARPSNTPTPGPGTPTATTPPSGPNATVTPRPFTEVTPVPQATNTPRPGSPAATSTPFGPPSGMATPRPPATGGTAFETAEGGFSFPVLIALLLILSSGAVYAVRSRQPRR